MPIPFSVFKSTYHLEHCAIEKCELDTHSIRFAGTTQQQEIIRLHLRPNQASLHKCPFCGEKCSVYDHQSKEVSWRSPALNGRPVYFVYSPARISCSEHGVLREYIPWAHGACRFTLDFCNEVAWMSLSLPKTAIATYFQISWVGNCIKVAHENRKPDTSRNELRQRAQIHHGCLRHGQISCRVGFAKSWSRGLRAVLSFFDGGGESSD